MKENNIIYVTAGEESGDMLGGEVLRHLKRKNSDLVIKGIGGNEMRSQGLISVFDSQKLGFMGFFELVRHIFVIRSALNTVYRSICNDRPELILMIDFSEFHIKLAKKIKKRLPDTKIIKYVSPQIWASRFFRIKDIVKYYDCLCCILPFESQIYRNEMIDCRYVGHPLNDKYDLRYSFTEFYEKFGLDENKTMISVFPGSRKQEIKKHMPVISDYFRILSNRYPDVQFVICKSSNLKEDIFDNYKVPADVKIISSNHQWEIMSYSGIVLCKSGTSTLQTAIACTPSIVFYKVNFFSFLIASRIVTSEYISLPNIIAGKQINPELIQSDFNAPNLLRETEKLLKNEDIYDLRKKELKIVKGSLGGKGAAVNVANIVEEYFSTKDL